MEVIAILCEIRDLHRIYVQRKGRLTGAQRRRRARLAKHWHSIGPEARKAAKSSLQDRV